MYAIRSYYAWAGIQIIMICSHISRTRSFATGKPTAICCDTMEIGASPASTLGGSGEYRITSYNVCYTKLLRIPSALRCGPRVALPAMFETTSIRTTRKSSSSAHTRCSNKPYPKRGCTGCQTGVRYVPLLPLLGKRIVRLLTRSNLNGCRITADLSNTSYNFV